MTTIQFIRPDFIFSYWIFLWWILYALKIVDINPKFAIILGLIANSIMLILYIYIKEYYVILPFIIINTFIKIIPLMHVWNTKITFNDVFFTLLLFAIYLCWIFYNNFLLIFTQKDVKFFAPFEYYFVRALPLPPH
jgi:hypothetical protein